MANGQPDPSEATLIDVQKPISARDASVGMRLSVTLDLSGLNSRSLVAVFVRSSAAAVFCVEGALNPVDGSFRVCDTIELGGAGQEIAYYQNAFPYVRVRTENPNNSEIDMSATR